MPGDELSTCNAAAFSAYKRGITVTVCASSWSTVPTVPSVTVRV
jgi:hypothetical protein